MAARYVDDSDKAIKHRLLRVSDISKESDKIRMPITGFNMMSLVSLEEAVRPLLLILPKIQEYVSVAKQRCEKPPADGLTLDESASIMLYSMDWEPEKECLYFVLNETLRADDRKRLNPWFLFMKLFMTALDKLPSNRCSIYRGVKLDLSKNYSEGTTFHWWAFSSCTSSVKALENESFLGKIGVRTLFSINCTSGKDISHHSYYQTEAEILLLPGCHFRVVSCRQQSSDFHLIELEEIPSSVSTFSIVRRPVIHQQQLSNTANDRCNPNFILQERKNVRSENHLQEQQLTDRDMKTVIEQMILLKQPTSLNLALNQISSEGVSILADAFYTYTCLEELNLAGNQILDRGVDFLSQVLWSNAMNLKILNLSCAGITDQGVEYLTNMLKTNSTLTHLYLFQNQIGNSGVELFAQVLIHDNVTLEYLSLWENNLINDSCFDALVKCSRALKIFLVSSSNLSETASERLFY